MLANPQAASQVAEFLLQIKAIVLKPNDPFTWASGWQSPIYCDNRKTLSYPKIRNFIREATANAVEEHYGKPDVIAGVATGGIAQGALVAEALGLPFIYVRSSSKGHGMQNLVEGVVESGQSVVVIEDLVSTGGSSLKAVEALREKGCKVLGMVAIFTYGFQIALDNFSNSDCSLITLADYNTLIKKAMEINYVSEKDEASLARWRENPQEWGI